ncbi:hypothetical protein [Nostoc sp.]|uniref:hypothetical protein n=1 Tax=Nostoc sp. TaxID=1180 RepID=UPI002FF8E7F4
MAIAELFLGLYNHIQKLEFSETNDWELGAIASLFPLNFDEAGNQIKEILESTYTDGITGLEDVENDGSSITGVFLDQVSPTITKRYQFTITPDNISYKLKNPSDLDDADFTELEFAASKMFGGSKKKKNCVNSTSCGFSCIKKGLQCRKEPTLDQKQAIASLIAKSSNKTKATTPKSNTKKTTTSKNDVSDTEKAKTPIGVSVTKNYRDRQGEKISVTNTENGGMVFKKANGDIAATLDKEYISKVAEGIKYTAEVGRDTSIDKFYSKEGERYIQAKIRPANDDHSGYVDIRIGADTSRETGEKGVRIAYKTAQKIFSDKITALSVSDIPDTEKEKIALKADQTQDSGDAPNSDKRIHSIRTTKDFEDAALYAYSKLADKHDNLVPIHEIRESLGETVSRDKFDEYMKDMQANDLLQFKGGSLASGNREKLQDSLQTPGSGLRTYATLEISKDDLEKKLAGKTEKISKLLDNPPSLDRMGTARVLQKGAKIKDESDFTKNADIAYKRLNDEFKYDNLVPIEKIREALGDRVSATDFDKYVAKLVENDKYQPMEATNPTPSEEKNGYKTQFGTKHYLKKL